MDVLFAQSGMTLLEFAASFSRWFVMPPLEHRFSDNVPGGEYFCCYVPGLKIIVCESDSDALSDERFMIYLTNYLEIDSALLEALYDAILRHIKKRLQGEGIVCKRDQV